MRRNLHQARPALFAIAFALPLLSTSGAFAQPVPAASASTAPPRDPQAEADYQRGVQAFRDRRYGDARTAFGAAVNRQPNAASLFALGQACRNSGRYVEAVSAFERFLATPPANDDAQMRTEVREQVAQIRRSLATLSVEMSPPRATLQIDGRVVEPSNAAMPLDPGPHVIELSGEGYRAERREVTATPGGQLVLRIELHPAAHRRTHLMVEPDVGSATVTIDGQVTGHGLVDAELPAGDHLVEIEAAGYQPWRRSVHLDASQPTRLTANLTRRGLPGWVLPVSIAGGVAVVGAAIAIGVAASSGGASDALPSDLHVIATAQGIAVRP